MTVTAYVECSCDDGATWSRGDGGYDYAVRHDICDGTGRITKASLEAFLAKWAQTPAERAAIFRHAWFRQRADALGVAE